jgi:hypothetical protein
MGKYLTTKDWIERFRDMHGDKFSYPDVIKGSKNSINVFCNKHNTEFETSPQLHLRSVNTGCKKCYADYIKERDSIKPLEKIKQFKTVHGGKYTYHPETITLSQEDMKITCPTHGEFWQQPLHHQRGHGCPKCGYYSAYKKDRWVEKSNEKNPKLYILELNKDEEVFYKIGITGDTLEKRFSGRLPYEYKVVAIVENEASKIWELEKKLLRLTKEYKYTPSIDFEGMTECRTGGVELCIKSFGEVEDSRGGNYYLSSGLVEMGAEANIGTSWYEAK